VESPLVLVVEVLCEPASGGGLEFKVKVTDHASTP